MTTLCIPQDLRFPAGDRALGSDAGRLRESLRSASPPDRSIALVDPEEKLASALTESFDTPVEEATVEYAGSLLNALPLAFQSTVDVQVEPGGEVLFEWAASSKWILTLAINETGRLAYSGHFGTNRTRGMELFEGAVPQSIALAIARIGNR